jgi:ribosomal protein S18 acetylase RimI-like enzyme
MKIRPLVGKDRTTLLSVLTKTRSFTFTEIEVAMELIDVVLKDPIQKDYHIYCVVDGQDQAIGYICYGPTPMAQGTFNLYGIAVDPDFQGQRWVQHF